MGMHACALSLQHAEGALLRPLSQVQYSLMYRAPETNGVLGVCKEKGITLVAYSPLAQGILTGKGASAPTPIHPLSSRAA